jgi:hypothetical protein
LLIHSLVQIFIIMVKINNYTKYLTFKEKEIQFLLRSHLNHFFLVVIRMKNNKITHSSFIKISNNSFERFYEDFKENRFDT